MSVGRTGVVAILEKCCVVLRIGETILLRLVVDEAVVAFELGVV